MNARTLFRRRTHGALTEPESVARRETFERLSQQRLARSYRLATALLRDEVEAEDAVNDAALHAWLHWSSLRDQDKFDAWFDRIVVNCCRSRLRNSARSARVNPMRSSFEHSRFDDRVVQREALSTALEALPVDHRLVVVLRFVEDMTIEQIADLTQLREGTVKSRLHYGLRQLRAAYDAADRE